MRRIAGRFITLSTTRSRSKRKNRLVSCTRKQDAKIAANVMDHLAESRLLLLHARAAAVIPSFDYLSSFLSLSLLSFFFFALYIFKVHSAYWRFHADWAVFSKNIPDMFAVRFNNRPFKRFQSPLSAVAGSMSANLLSPVSADFRFPFFVLRERKERKENLGNF